MAQSCFIRSYSLGYTHDLTRQALAHTIRNKSEATYHRKGLLNERRPMMQVWEDYDMSPISKA